MALEKSRRGGAGPADPFDVSRRELVAGGFKWSAIASMATMAGFGCSSIHDRMQQITGPTPARWLPFPANEQGAHVALHILNRVANGPRPGDLAAVLAAGVPGYLEEQLADNMAEDPVVTWRVDGLDVQQMERDSPDELYSTADNELVTETQQAMLLRAIYSRHQLRETLADFWTNHFNIYALKNDGRTLIPGDTEGTIRPHVLGSFRDMLFASAHSPAMLSYLDNNQNARGVPNENYARELLELHTLGVHSGYTQHDIQQVARCFTGWTVQTGWRRGEFTYDPKRHDDGRKEIPFLGLVTGPGGGKRDAETVLERLAVHPATARNLSTKLCMRFMGSAPEPIVSRAASEFVRTGSDIRSTLRPILFDGLTNLVLCRPLFKRPLDYVVSSMRVLAADTDGGQALQHRLLEMGQPLYQWPMPDGFPERASAWTGSLLPRWNFAIALVSNSLPGTSIDITAPLTAAKARTDDEVLSCLIGTIAGLPATSGLAADLKHELSAHMSRARSSGVNGRALLEEFAGLLLASPECQWK